MTEDELVHGYLNGRIDRRRLMSGLLTAGLSAAAATAFVDTLAPPAEAAETTTASTKRPVVDKLKPSSGPTAGGTHVVITGEHLGNATSCHFGTNKAKILKHISSTSLKVEAPAGHGSVDVTVTNKYGTSAKRARDVYTYVKPPVVTAINPTSGPEAGNTTVVITGKHFVGVQSVHFGSTKAGILKIVSSTEIKVTSPAGTGTVKVTVTTKYGKSTNNVTFTYTGGGGCASCGSCGSCASCGSCGSCGFCGSCFSCGGCASCGGCGSCFSCGGCGCAVPAQLPPR